MGYIKGKERGQSVLFPGTVDEYIGENNEVRAIAAFLGRLDFVKLRFVRGQAAGTGRPGYDPRLLMGLFLWGHLNGIRSSRKLERESHRNLEVIWLCENLRPDFKTIADFRKDNGAGIKGVVVEFRLWCLRAGLYGKEIVAVDGSKFKAVNSKERNFTKKKLSQIIARERAKISEYLEAVAVADETESEEPELSAAQLKEKIAGLERYLAEHEELERQLEATGESQVSLTVMAFQAKEALQVAELTVLADGGYYEGNALKECEQAGITTFVSVPKSKEAERLGIFAQSQFRYDQEQDLYVCPQGEELHWTKTTNDRERNKKFKVYATKACAQCPLRAQCTTSKYGRKIKRWVDQGVIDRLRERIRGQPELLKQRKTLAEHPFGTIKRGMNQGFFLLKGISKVTTETGLTVLSYNLKRVLNIMGVEQMISSLAKANPCSA